MDLALLAPQAGMVQKTAAALLACNHTSARFGLVLREAEAAALAAHQADTLRSAGRVEFGAGILPALTFAFCDSPFLAPHNYAETLYELTECFYHFKNQTLDRVSDADLLEFMKRQFDGPCQGAVEFLRETALEALADSARGLAAERADDEDRRSEEAWPEAEGTESEVHWLGE